MVSAARLDESSPRRSRPPTAGVGRPRPAHQGAQGRQRRQDRHRPAALDAATAEADRIATDARAQMRQLAEARLDNVGATLDQMQRTWPAGTAVTDALTRPRPPRTGDQP